MNAGPDTTGNDLLDRIAGPARIQVLRFAKRISLAREEEIIKPGAEIKRLLFPVSAVCCSLVSLRSGQRTEVNTVGKEGFVGIAAILGSATSPEVIVAQLAGDAYAVETRPLLALCEREEAVRRPLLDFAGYALHVGRQTAACNAYHNIEQRVARWLLTADDRAPSEQFHMTHELLTHMVSATRPRVSEAAAKLRSNGLIDYSAGQVVIRDRARLEDMACECYAEMVRTLDASRRRTPADR